MTPVPMGRAAPCDPSSTEDQCVPPEHRSAHAPPSGRHPPDRVPLGWLVPLSPGRGARGEGSRLRDQLPNLTNRLNHPRHVRSVSHSHQPRIRSQCISYRRWINPSVSAGCEVCHLHSAMSFPIPQRSQYGVMLQFRRDDMVAWLQTTVNGQVEAVGPVEREADLMRGGGSE